MYLTGNQKRVSQESIVKTLLIIFLLVNRITESVSTQKLFHTVVVYSKPPTEKKVSVIY